MMALAGMLADLSGAVTGSLVAAAWQGVLLAASVWLGLRLLPKTPAAVRFAIWFGVFLVVTVLPVIALWPHAAVGGGHGPWLVLDPRWSMTIAAVWLAASIWRAGQLAVAAVRVRGLWKRAVPVESVATHDDGTVMDGAPKVMDRRAPVCVSDEVDRPTVIGFFAPKILIPSWLLEKLSAGELEQVVLHESGHLGRADDWMNLLQKVALVVFPLNPALAWVERRLCFERELACDERVLRVTGAPKAYAACLTTLAEYRLGRRGLALAIGVLGRESELGQRVTRILRRGAQMKPWQAKLVLGGAMLGLVVAATGLERCPELVGFSEVGSQVVAHRQQGQPTHGDETAMNGAPGFGARSVVLRMSAGQAQEWKTVGDAGSSVGKTPKNREVWEKAHVTDEKISGPARTVEVASRAPERRADRDVNALRASVSDPSQEGDVVLTQWTMVTQFHDGSRMVLTTAQVSSSLPRVEQDSDTPAAAQQGAHPYAAVPVRGGWLVFQL